LELNVAGVREPHAAAADKLGQELIVSPQFADQKDELLRV